MKLAFEKVDQIWAATGEGHYYRMFPIDEGWIVYIHRLPHDDSEDTPARGVPVTATTYDNAQVFAQAFEDAADDDVMSVRIAQATREAYLRPHGRRVVEQ